MEELRKRVLISVFSVRSGLYRFKKKDNCTQQRRKFWLLKKEFCQANNIAYELFTNPEGIGLVTRYPFHFIFYFSSAIYR